MGNRPSIVAQIGPSTIGALASVAVAEKETRRVRARGGGDLGFGKAAVSGLRRLVGDDRWFAQLAAPRSSARSEPPTPCRSFNRCSAKTDPRVARAAVTALGKIDDQSAARAVQTVLRAATAHCGRPSSTRSSPSTILAWCRSSSRVIAESAPLGQTIEVVIAMVDALGTVGSEKAIPTLVTTSPREEVLWAAEN